MSAFIGGRGRHLSPAEWILLQGGFAVNPTDIDGGNYFNGIDFPKRAQSIRSAQFINMDMRVAKRSDFKERIKLHADPGVFQSIRLTEVTLCQTQAFQL